MANKKGFVRYANNKLVAGSLILANKAPKVGVWKEVPADLCCDEGCIQLYAIALIQGESLIKRAYYSDRDLQNIPGQCIDPSLAIGAKLYLDPQGTIPVVDDSYSPLIFQDSSLLYIVENGIITYATCPA